MLLGSTVGAANSKNERLHIPTLVSMSLVDRRAVVCQGDIVGARHRDGLWSDSEQCNNAFFQIMRFVVLLNV
jgi:hypothetical protein